MDVMTCWYSIGSGLFQINETQKLLLLLFICLSFVLFYFYHLCVAVSQQVNLLPMTYIGYFKVSHLNDNAFSLWRVIYVVQRYTNWFFIFIYLFSIFTIIIICFVFNDVGFGWKIFLGVLMMGFLGKSSFRTFTVRKVVFC